MEKKSMKSRLNASQIRIRGRRRRRRMNAGQQLSLDPRDYLVDDRPRSIDVVFEAMSWEPKRERHPLDVLEEIDLANTERALESAEQPSVGQLLLGKILTERAPRSSFPICLWRFVEHWFTTVNEWLDWACSFRKGGRNYRSAD